MNTGRLVHLCLCLAIASCAGRQTRPSHDDRSHDPSAIIVRGSELASNLLDGLRNRIPGMTVVYPSGQCPRIMFRGRRSASQQGNPSVYIDGTLMRDSCVLGDMPAADVDFVEVYPSGNTSRVGVQRNPYGLILVFRVGGGTLDP